MTYCIIDDEPIAHRIIEGYCKDLPHLRKVGNCYDAFQAMQTLSQHPVDLIFLDINMPKLTGFDLLKILRQPPQVIVTSAHQEFALEGYELDVADYLLKPFSFERFLRALGKLTDHQPATPPAAAAPNTSIFLKGDKKIHQVLTEEILFVEALGSYTKVFTTTGRIICHEKISSLEGRLAPFQFLRVHKSFLVAIKKIRQIEGNRLLVGDHQVPIGQTYKHRVKQLLEG